MGVYRDIEGSGFRDWGFPKLEALFWGSDCNRLGSIGGSPVFGETTISRTDFPV